MSAVDPVDSSAYRIATDTSNDEDSDTDVQVLQSLQLSSASRLGQMLIQQTPLHVTDACSAPNVSFHSDRLRQSITVSWVLADVIS